jgi:adenine deaminase
VSKIDRIEGQLIDLHKREIYPASIEFESKRIKRITRLQSATGQYILPGFVDAHIHIESSMLVPYEFAKIALQWGTVATVSDPHEIANVVGLKGVYYMIENAKDAILKFNFGAPSCVPATSFETAGAVIDSRDIETLMASDDILYLSEMMNYPGVLHGDKEVLKKIEIAKKYNKPIDGHAPGLKGDLAQKYIAAGISTDHECFTEEEARDKLSFGMKILIREGSAAKNYNALHALIPENSDKMMFCSDDLHPDDLLEGHINKLVKRSLDHGYNLFDILTMACVNPVNHYNLDVGLLREGDFADFIIIDNPDDFNVLKTFINGELVAEKGSCVLPDKEHSIINNFGIDHKKEEDFIVNGKSKNVAVIHAIDGELITEKLIVDLPTNNGVVLPDIDKDILKISVVNRYNNAPVASGFIKNIGIKNGAIASTVGHDSHNIIVVGTSDELICRAVNLLIDSKGGLSAISTSEEMQLELPIAGLISDLDANTVGIAYSKIDKMVKKMGSELRAPFMTLSFMALLVIPKIKMSDKGLFDAENFCFIN